MGVRFGTLLVSKGAVEWRPTNKVYPRRLSWSRFDALMRESGRLRVTHPPLSCATTG